MASYPLVVTAVWVILGGAGVSLLVWQFIRGRRTSTTSQATKRLLAGLFAVVILLVGLTLLMGQFYGVMLGGRL